MPEQRYDLKLFKYSSHYWILKTLTTENAPLRILDIGASTGYLGMMLRKNGHHLVGIEKHAESAEKARAHYDSFHLADIETFEFPFQSEFDYLLFADVLEHLRDPVSVLRRALPALKPSGKVIVSVPNVANLFVRLSLLFGRFDYMERGILDRTHLRFFTLRTLKAMMQEASCRVIDIVPTPVPLQLVFSPTERNAFAPVHEAHYALTRMWKTMLAYQFVLTGVPDSPQQLSSRG